MSLSYLLWDETIGIPVDARWEWHYTLGTRHSHLASTYSIVYYSTSTTSTSRDVSDQAPRPSPFQNVHRRNYRT